MMTQYYFLASLLPHLEIGHVPELGFPELKQFIGVQLGEHDQEKFQKFMRLVDLDNFRAIWTGEPVDPRGNLTPDELEQALLNLSWSDGEPFPPYLTSFLAKNPKKEGRVKNFSRVVSRFLEDGRSCEQGFLGEYFGFEREWRLVMVGFRAKKLGRAVEVELQYEDPTDPIVAQILAQKDAKFYEPPFEYKELKPLFEAFVDAPLELYKALLKYRFDQFQEFFGQAIFSIDRILGYLAQLLVVEKYLELDVQKGIEIIDRIEEGVQ